MLEPDRLGCFLYPASSHPARVSLEYKQASECKHWPKSPVPSLLMSGYLPTITHTTNIKNPENQKYYFCILIVCLTCSIISLFLQFLTECLLTCSSCDGCSVISSSMARVDRWLSLFWQRFSATGMPDRVIWELLRTPRPRMLPRPIKSGSLGPRHKCAG